MGIEPPEDMVRGTVSPSMMWELVETVLVLILNILLLSFSALTGISFSASIVCGSFSNEDTKLLIDVENMNQRMGHMIGQNRYYR